MPYIGSLRDESNAHLPSVRPDGRGLHAVAVLGARLRTASGRNAGRFGNVGRRGLKISALLKELARRHKDALPRRPLLLRTAPSTRGVMFFPDRLRHLFPLDFVVLVDSENYQIGLFVSMNTVIDYTQ